jgi:hypothetical protein
VETGCRGGQGSPRAVAPKKKKKKTSVQLYVFPSSATSLLFSIYTYLRLCLCSSLLLSFFLSAVRLSPLGTSATVGLLYQTRMIDDECGVVGGMRIGRGNRSTRREPAPVPLCPPQITHDLTWDRTRACFYLYFPPSLCLCLPVISFHIHIFPSSFVLLFISLTPFSISSLLLVYFFYDVISEVLTEVVMKGTIFWDITLHSPLKVKRSFGGTYRLHLQVCLPPAFTLVYCSAYSSTLKMEAICSSETSVDFQRTTRRCVPEDSNLLLSYLFPSIFASYILFVSSYISTPNITENANQQLVRTWPDSVH